MAMDDFSASVDRSKIEESKCEPGSLTPSPALTLTPIPSEGFALQTSDGLCLTVAELIRHGVVTVEACDADSRWKDHNGYLANVAVKDSCLKLDKADHEKPCIAGNTIWIGDCQEEDPAFHVDGQ